VLAVNGLTCQRSSSSRPDRAGFAGPMWTLAVDHRKAATQTLAALPPGETLTAAETFETASQHAVGRGPGSPVSKLDAQRRRTMALQ
jgi:hypothetical protein